jgi:spore coat polysaccharide biosynthesis protein SpsF
LDTKEDFELIKKIFEALYPRNKSFSLGEILEYLDEHPELLRINNHVANKPVR